MTDEALKQVLIDWANPPPNMVGKLPKPTKRENQKGNCRECGGYHGLPAVHLDYMGHAAVTRALIEVDPQWTWEPVAFNEDGEPLVKNAGGHLRLWGRMTVLGKTLICVGTCDASKPEPEKELIGDLLRNGAMRFGVGLALWAKEEWADLGTAEQPPAEQPSAVSDTGEKVTDETWVRVSALKETLPPTVLVDLKAWVSANGWRFSKQGLTESQAVEALGWAERRVAS